MGTIKLTPGTWFAPFYGWTRSDYERALERAAPPPAPDVPRSPAGPVAAFLEAVGARAAWQRDALCLEYPELDWFDDHDQDAAKDVCRRCLVLAECQTAGEREVGVWGATTSRERARSRRAAIKCTDG